MNSVKVTKSSKKIFAWLACPSKKMSFWCPQQVYWYHESYTILIYTYIYIPVPLTDIHSVYIYINTLYIFRCIKEVNILYLYVIKIYRSDNSTSFLSSSGDGWKFMAIPFDDVINHQIFLGTCQRKLGLLKSAVVVYNSTNSLNKNQRTEQKYVIKIMTRIYVTTCTYINM